MMDQNITTIITSALTVFGTLGGVILGVILSNRYVARQAKASKNAAIIEEVYILLTNIDSEITHNIKANKPALHGEEVLNYLRRVQALVQLYLPSVREKLDIFINEMFKFSAKVSEAQKTSKLPNVWESVDEPYNDFKKELKEVKLALIRLVK